MKEFIKRKGGTIFWPKSNEPGKFGNKYWFQFYLPEIGLVVIDGHQETYAKFETALRIERDTRENSWFCLGFQVLGFGAGVCRDVKTVQTVDNSPKM